MDTAYPNPFATHATASTDDAIRSEYGAVFGGFGYVNNAPPVDPVECAAWNARIDARLEREHEEEVRSYAAWQAKWAPAFDAGAAASKSAKKPTKAQIRADARAKGLKNWAAGYR